MVCNGRSFSFFPLVSSILASFSLFDPRRRYLLKRGHDWGIKIVRARSRCPECFQRKERKDDHCSCDVHGEKERNHLQRDSQLYAIVPFSLEVTDTYVSSKSWFGNNSFKFCGGNIFHENQDTKEFSAVFDCRFAKRRRELDAREHDFVVDFFYDFTYFSFHLDLS